MNILPELCAILTAISPETVELNFSLNNDSRIEEKVFVKLAVVFYEILWYAILKGADNYAYH